MVANDIPAPGRRPLILAALLATLGATAGCYRYTAIPVTELEPTMTVRMELSGVAVDRLRSGPDSIAKLLDGFRVNGTVSRLAADTLLLAVPKSFMEANVRLKTELHVLPLFRSDVQRVQTRRLDRKRTTWSAVALAAVGAGAAAFALSRGGRATGSIPKPVDPTDSWVRW